MMQNYSRNASYAWSIFIPCYSTFSISGTG